MKILFLTLLTIYILGFMGTFLFHVFLLQMVTFELALLRSFVWPIFFLTGWPRGTPMPMD